MIFKTKYNIGDEVWVYYNMMPTKVIIKRISFYCGKRGHLLKKLRLHVFITNSFTFVKSVERLNKLMLSKMKQYTTPEQTAKLIELGFEKPKSIEKVTYIEQYGCGYETAYSIGELIEMLGVHLSSIYYIIGIEWFVNAEGLERRSEELVDALYDMCVKLKEEGVI